MELWLVLEGSHRSAESQAMLWGPLSLLFHSSWTPTLISSKLLCLYSVSLYHTFHLPMFLFCFTCIVRALQQSFSPPCYGKPVQSYCVFPPSRKCRCLTGSTKDSHRKEGVFGKHLKDWSQHQGPGVTKQACNQ